MYEFKPLCMKVQETYMPRNLKIKFISLKETENPKNAQQ